MKIKWILILCFAPLTFFAQNKLECCESVEDVEVSLNGYWKLKPSDFNK